MKYDIVLISFPFDDLFTTKVRPAVCLTEPIGPYNHVILAFITSNIQNAKEQSDLIINPTDENFDLTGLMVSSVVKLHRLTTIPINLIKRNLGKLNENHIAEIKNKLRNLLDL